MSPHSSRRAALRAGGSVALALLAGCIADGDGTPTDPSPTATDAGPTDAGTPTREPVGTGRNPADVVVTNEASEPRTLTLRVTRAGAADPAFEETVRLDAGERRRWDVFSPDATDTYVVALELSTGAESSYEWNLSEQPEAGWLSVGVEADGSMQFAYAMA